MVSKMRREDLAKAIQEYGETPPKSWTVPELRTRLAQLHDEHGVVPGKPAQTDLRKWVIKLNVASKKKTTLQEFCQSLKIPLTMTETIAQLQKIAMTRIYEISHPDPTDPVGFGKAASLSYEEVKMDVNYCAWVLKTWEEGGTCPQLARLAKWLQSEQNETTPEQIDVKMNTKEPNLSLQTQNVITMKEMDAQSTNSRGSSQALMDAMAVIMDTMKELKGEIADLQEHRPRKKVESSEGSFSVVSGRST